MRDHREQIGMQRVLIRCIRCGEMGYFDRSMWVHLHVPTYRHRFVPVAAPSEAEQDHLDTVHRADYGDPVVDHVDDPGDEVGIL